MSSVPLNNFGAWTTHLGCRDWKSLIFTIFRKQIETSLPFLCQQPGDVGQDHPTIPHSTKQSNYRQLLHLKTKNVIHLEPHRFAMKKFPCCNCCKSHPAFQLAPYSPPTACRSKNTGRSKPSLMPERRQISSIPNQTLM